MVRWRLCLAIAIMLLLPTVISGKQSDDDEDDEEDENKEDLRPKISKPKINENNRRAEDSDDDDDEDEDDDDDTGDEKSGKGTNILIAMQDPIVGRRAPMIMVTPKTVYMSDPKISKRRPLECFVCAYKQETPLKACLDPTKFRVHTITCHSIDDRCFTSVVTKGGTNYEAIVRGCRSGCVATAETTCCEMNRCNNKAFAMPMAQPHPQRTSSATLSPLRPLSLKSKSSKCLPPTVVFFITILLILQTVGKVAFV